MGGLGRGEERRRQAREMKKPKTWEDWGGASVDAARNGASPFRTVAATITLLTLPAVAPRWVLPLLLFPRAVVRR